MSRTPGAEAKIGPVLATLLVAGNMIGSGIYLLPASLAAIGSASLIGWGIASAGALALAGVFAALARRRPDPDGIVAYPAEALGRFFGFQSGFAYWVAGWVGNVGIALAVTGYLTVFLPVLKQPGWALAATITVIWALTAANLLGARHVGRLAGATLAAGLVPLVIATAAGFQAFDPAVFTASWNVSGRPLVQAVPASLVLVFWAFLGLESATVAAAAVRRPERNVPVAALAGVGLAAAVYMAATAAIMGVIPAAELARSTAPFADVAGRLLGPAAGLLVAACALLKTSGSLAGWILVTAQCSRSAASQGLFPRAISSTDPDALPVRDLLLAAVLMTLVAFATAQPTLGRQFGVIANVAVVLQMVVYAYCCVALLRFTAGPAASAAAVAGFAFCAWVVAASDRPLLGLTAALLLASAPLYLLAARRRRALTDSAAGPS